MDRHLRISLAKRLLIMNAYERVAFRESYRKAINKVPLQDVKEVFLLSSLDQNALRQYIDDQTQLMHKDLIILAEEKPESRQKLKEEFEKSGYEVRAFDNGAAAYEAIASQMDPRDDIARAVLAAGWGDGLSGPGSGIELVRKVREKFPKLPIMMWDDEKFWNISSTMKGAGADFCIEIGDAKSDLRSCVNATLDELDRRIYPLPDKFLIRSVMPRDWQDKALTLKGPVTPERGRGRPRKTDDATVTLARELMEGLANTPEKEKLLYQKIDEVIALGISVGESTQMHILQENVEKYQNKAFALKDAFGKQSPRTQKRVLSRITDIRRMLNGDDSNKVLAALITVDSQNRTAAVETLYRFDNDPRCQTKIKEQVLIILNEIEKLLGRSQVITRP